MRKARQDPAVSVRYRAWAGKVWRAVVDQLNTLALPPKERPAVYCEALVSVLRVLEAMTGEVEKVWEGLRGLLFHQGVRHKTRGTFIIPPHCCPAIS